MEEFKTLLTGTYFNNKNEYTNHDEHFILNGITIHFRSNLADWHKTISSKNEEKWEYDLQVSKEIGVYTLPNLKQYY